MLTDYPLYAKIIEAGSLSAAARELKMSPAMVSKRLSRLEARLGVRLVHRTTRRLVTTDIGQKFYEQVAAILSASREAERMVAGRASQPSGPLRVTAPTSFGRLHVAPYLKAFLERYPEVEVELDLSDAFVDFLSDRFDLAIRIGPAVNTNLVSRRLASNRRVLCAAPSYLQEHGEPTKIEDLTHHALIAATNQLPWRLEGPGGPRLVAGKSVVRTNSSEVVRELAVAGLGIALRSTWDVGAELRSGALRQVLPGYEGATDVAIFAVHPPASLVPPAVSAFIQYLQNLYAPIAPWD